MGNKPLQILNELHNDMLLQYMDTIIKNLEMCSHWNHIVQKPQCTVLLL